ncbi:hypothetical protein EV191_12455 [Tamaricihabitans halophyticus]|uniref:DUF2231 domain-containing protein n=1 Tax=Tamaricihabitans halophyticus TaxID=1262583 RepID=A0A4R2Q156_9PSEU|nr:hypothetical protein [Tamaricihabitans halophyticus]TCP42089.1 hypothetical protein EV191_12455 [Tamaricihabitans halophyticus]
MTKTVQRRWVAVTLHAGLALTVLATIVPYVDRAVLVNHIRAGYPSYTQAELDSAVSTYLVLLSIIGALGVIAWLWTVWAVRTDKRWARPAATVMFVLGTSIGLIALLTKDTSGATGLPPTLGWIGLAPCLVGAVAVMLVWKRPQPE